MLAHCFSEEWVSANGQKLTFTNLTSIKFKEDSLSNLGDKIARWKNASIVFSLNNQGNALCKIDITPDNYDPIGSIEWIAWLYNWFILSIEDSNQRIGFMDLGFFVKFRLNFSRGEIEQYAALRQSGYVEFYDDMHFEAGGYKADSTDIYDWLYPKYNAASKSWNSGYLYRYIIGDFESIKNLPVPQGLDDSFKKDIVRIPNIIEAKNWGVFNGFVTKYNLKLKNYFNVLLENNAPLSTFSAFSEGQRSAFDYTSLIPEIIKKDGTYFDFFYKYFNKKEKELFRDNLKDSPDSFIEFYKKQNLEISSVYEVLLENIILDCSLENVEYATKSYDIKLLAPVMSKLDKNKIEKILKNRNDEVSNFLRFYYLEFEDNVSVEKLLDMAKKLGVDLSDFFTTKIYDIEKTIAEKLTEEEFSAALQNLFERDILKLIISKSDDISISADYNLNGIKILNYEKSSAIKHILYDSLLEVAYKIYTDNSLVEKLFFPESIIQKGCKFSVRFEDDSYFFDSKSKSGKFLLGELKKGKIVKKHIHIVNSENETLLFLSIRNGNNKFSQQLIKEGIDVNVKNLDGKTALDIAKEMGNTKIQKILERNMK